MAKRNWKVVELDSEALMWEGRTVLRTLGSYEHEDSAQRACARLAGYPGYHVCRVMHVDGHEHDYASSVERGLQAELEARGLDWRMIAEAAAND